MIYKEQKNNFIQNYLDKLENKAFLSYIVDNEDFILKEQNIANRYKAIIKGKKYNNIRNKRNKKEKNKKIYPKKFQKKFKKNHR